jgi:hypothetical protein
MITPIFYYNQSTIAFISQTLKTKILDSQILGLIDSEEIISLQLCKQKV